MRVQPAAVYDMSVSSVIQQKLIELRSLTGILIEVFARSLGCINRLWNTGCLNDAFCGSAHVLMRILSIDNKHPGVVTKELRTSGGFVGAGVPVVMLEGTDVEVTVEICVVVVITMLVSAAPSFLVRHSFCVGPGGRDRKP